MQEGNLQPYHLCSIKNEGTSVDKKLLLNYIRYMKVTFKSKISSGELVTTLAIEFIRRVLVAAALFVCYHAFFSGLTFNP